MTANSLNPKNEITIRPVQQSDVPLIDEMHDRVSKDSMYFRYLGPTKPSHENLQRLCSSDDNDGYVVVAVDPGPQEKIVGIACYHVDSDNPNSAEPAVLVEDSYQGQGLGKQIVLNLFNYAQKNGVETFVSYIHPVNQKVLKMIQGSGLPYKIRYSDGLKEVRVQLKSV